MKTPLKQLREARGLTASQVAEEIKIDQGHYSRIENKGCKNPEVAEKLADYFGREWITELHILYPDRYPNFSLAHGAKPAEAA